LGKQIKIDELKRVETFFYVMFAFLFNEGFDSYLANSMSPPLSEENNWCMNECEISIFWHYVKHMGIRPLKKKSKKLITRTENW